MSVKYRWSIGGVSVECGLVDGATSSCVGWVLVECWWRVGEVSVARAIVGGGPPIGEVSAKCRRIGQEKGRKGQKKSPTAILIPPSWHLFLAS